MWVVVANFSNKKFMLSLTQSQPASAYSVMHQYQFNEHLSVYFKIFTWKVISVQLTKQPNTDSFKFSCVTRPCPTTWISTCQCLSICLSGTQSDMLNLGCITFNWRVCDEFHDNKSSDSYLSSSKCSFMRSNISRKLQIKKSSNICTESVHSVRSSAKCETTNLRGNNG